MIFTASYLVLLPQLFSQQTQSIVSNGGFELPMLRPGIIASEFIAGETFGGWTVETGSVDILSTYVLQSATGQQSVELTGSTNQAGAIYQDLPTQVGRTYQLRFAMAGNPAGDPSVKEMQVWWGSSLVDTLSFNVSGHSLSNMGWTHHEYLLDAVSTTTRLRFVSLTHSIYGPTIDDVRVICSCVIPCTCLSPGAGPAGTNLLVNGGFEDEPLWGHGVGRDGGFTAFIGNDVPGWTVEPGHAITIHNNRYYPFISGTYSVNMDGEGYSGHNANFYQDFPTRADAQYEFSFDWECWWYSSRVRLEVTLEDMVTHQLLYDATFNYDPALHHESASFSGTGNPVRLRVQENPESGFNDNVFIVDNFVVTSNDESPYYHFDLTIPIGGAASASTKGGETSTRIGYATSPVTSGQAPYGIAVFRFKQNGVVVSEVAVPASPLTTLARLFVDYRSGIATPPGPGGPASIDVNTGLAVVNPGADTANVIYILRATDGTRIATGHGTVDAGRHFAKFIRQLIDVAPDFDLPSNFASATQFGSLEIRSDQPLSILGLRITVNQRGESLITSTPVADLTKPLSTTPLYFPQVADGGGYITTVILLNPSGKPETGRLSLFADDGSPLILNQVGGTRDSSFAYAIQPYGVFLFQTDGSPANTNAGSVQVTSDAGSWAPIGVALFSFTQREILVTESGVPAATPATHARIYIDQSWGHGTALAIANLGQSGANVTLKAYKIDGTTPADYTKPQVKLNPNGHTARFVRQLISDLPANFTGVLDVSSATPILALTLRSLENERNEFLLTTFPTADQTQPAPAPILFPQVVDGGGYVTEFILLSAGGGASTSVNLYSEMGVPMLIGK